MTIIDDIVTSMWEPAVYRSTGSLGWFELESEIRFHFQYISKWIHHDLLTWDTMHECLGCYLGHECCYRRDIVIRGTQKSWYCCVDCKTLTFFMYDNKTRRPTSEVMSSSTEDSYFHVISCDENTDYQELLKDRMRECLRFCEKNFDSCKRARTQVFSGVVYVDSDDVPTNVSPFTVVDPKSQTWVNIKVYQEPTCVFEDPICCERYGNSLRCLLHGCYTYEFVKDLYKVGEERLKSHYVVEKGKESESNSTTTGCEKTFEKEKEAAGKCRKHLTTSVMSNESDRSSRDQIRRLSGNCTEVDIYHRKRKTDFFRMLVRGTMRRQVSLSVMLLCLILQIDVIHGELCDDCKQLYLHGDAGFGKSSYIQNRDHTLDCRHGQFRHDVPKIRYADTGWGGPRGPEHADVQNWFRDKTLGNYDGLEHVNVQNQFRDKPAGIYEGSEDANVQNRFPKNSPRKCEGLEDVDVEHWFRRTPEQCERHIQFDMPCSETDASMFVSRDNDNDGVKIIYKQGFYIERQTLVVVSLCIQIILCSCVVYVGGLIQILRLYKVSKKEKKQRSMFYKTKTETFENHHEESKTPDCYAYLETIPCVQETSIQSEATRPTTSLSCISTIPAENEEEILDNRRDNTHKDLPDPQENVSDENVFDILKLKCISENESEAIPTILADPFSMSDLKTSKLKVLSDTYYDELPCPDATLRKKLVKTEIDSEKTVKDNKKTFKSDDGNGLLGNEYDQLENYNEKDETCVKTLMKKENVKSQEKPQESLYIYSSGCSGYPKKSTSSEGPMRSSDTINSSETGTDYTVNRDGDLTPSVQWRDTKVPCESSFHCDIDDSIDYESHSSCWNVSGYESVEDEEVKNEIETSDETKNDEIRVRKLCENKLHVISEEIEENDVLYTTRKNDIWIDKTQDKNSAHVEIIDNFSGHTKLKREVLDGADKGKLIQDGLDETVAEKVKASDDDCKYQESNVNDCLSVVQFHENVSEDKIESKENVKEQYEFLYHLGVVYTHLLSVFYCTEVWVTYFITKIEVKYPVDLTEEQQHESECVAGEWSGHYEDGDESLRIDSGFESYGKLSMDSCKPNDFKFDDTAPVATDSFEIHENSSHQSCGFDCRIFSYKQMPVEFDLLTPISPDSEQIEKRALQPSSRPEPSDTRSITPFISPSQNAPWTHFYRGLGCNDVPVAFCLVKSEFQRNDSICSHSDVGAAGGDGHQDVTKHSETMDTDLADRVSSPSITATYCPIISIGLTGKDSLFNLRLPVNVVFSKKKLIRNIAKDAEAIMKADTEITDDEGYETASQGQHDYGKDSVIESILEPKAPLIGHTQAYEAHLDKNNNEDMSDCLILLNEESSERSDQEKTNLLDTCDNNVDENQTEKEQVVIVELEEDYSRDDRTHDVEQDLNQKQPEDPAKDEGVVMTSVQLGHTEPPGLTKDNKENSYVPDSVYSNNDEDDFDNTGDFCINNMFDDIHVEGETARIHTNEIPTIIQVENNESQINNLDGQNPVNDESHDEVSTQTIRRIRKRIRRKRKRKESTQNYRHNNEDCSLSSDDEVEKVPLDVEMEAHVYLCSMSTRVSTLLNQTKFIGDELETSIDQLEQVAESLTELTSTACQHAENLPGKSEASSKRKRKKIDRFCKKCHRSKFEFNGKCTSDCHVIVFGNTCTNNVAESRPEMNEQYIVEITKSIDSGFASIESIKSDVVTEMDRIKGKKYDVSCNENFGRNLESNLKDKEEMIKVELKQHWMEQLYHPMGFRPAVSDISAYPAGLGGYFQRLEQGPVSQEESLSYEWLRLHSLRNYQGNGSIIQLSRHGFYHDEEHGPNATRCYKCNLLYSDWNYFDNIQEIHRRLSPNCPLLNEHEELSGSQVNLPSDSDASRSAPQGDATAVNDRQAPVTTANRETASVENVTSSLADTHIGGRNLDTEGFPSQPTEDRDNSQFARATPGISGTHRAAPVLSNVRTTTHGRARHTPPTDVNNTATGARSNESSTTANTTTTTISTSQSSNQTGMNTNTPTSGGPEKVRERAQGNGGFSTAAPRRDDPSRDEQLYGINNPSLVNVENPKHRDYRTIDSRTNSFTSLWPSYLDQTPRQMSEAGFFYAGVADFTRCFACGGGLRNWEAGDDPCLEHTRWYPRCEYMNKLKGSRYVDAVSRRQEQHLAEQRRRQQQQHEQRQQAQNRSSTPQDPLSTPAAAVLLEMGYSRERIREAISTVRRNTGHNSVSAEQALLWILDQDERQQSQNHIATSTASQSATTSAATTGATASLSVSVSSSASAQSSSSSNASSSSSSSNATSWASSSASASVSSAQGQRSHGQGQSSANKKNGDKKGDDKKEKNEGKEPQRKGAEGEQPSSSKKKKNWKKKNKGGGANSGNVGGANSDNVGGANSNVGGSNGSNVGGANGSNVGGANGSNMGGANDSNVGGANADVGNEGGATGGGEAEERADSLSELREMDTQSLRAENQKLREMQTCKICMDKPVNMTLLPCGHLVCCESCVSHLRKCPICRKRIEGSVKTFMS